MVADKYLSHLLGGGGAFFNPNEDPIGSNSLGGPAEAKFTSGYTTYVEKAMAADGQTLMYP